MNCRMPILSCCWVIVVCLIATVGCAEQSSTPLAVVTPSGAVGGGADSTFEAPVRFTSPEGPVHVEAPGYA